MKYLMICLSGFLLLLQPLVADDLSQAYEREHADIARLVHELDYLAGETQKLQQKYQAKNAPLLFNYQRLVDLLEQESQEIRSFINLKYQTPLAAEQFHQGRGHQ